MREQWNAQIIAGMQLAKKIKQALAPDEPWSKVLLPLGYKMGELKKKLRPAFEHLTEVQFLHTIGAWSVDDIRDALS